MSISPTSERTILKGIPPSEQSFPELTSNDLSSEIDRMSHAEEIVNPIKMPIQFNEGTGYAGTFPLSNDVSLWPGPRGGAFLWLSSSTGEQGSESYVQAKQKIKLHRLELQLPAKSGEFEDDSAALYTCREANLQRANPAFSFFKKMFTNPRRTLIHPSSTLSGLESQKRSDLTLLADFPFGALGGRDARPVIWNNFKGHVTEFDPKSLKSRDEHDVLKGASAVSRQPIHDASSGKFLVIQRTDGVGSDGRYSQFRLLMLVPNLPRIATFMAPRAMSLNLLACDQAWAVCSSVFYNRRLFYLVNRQEGRLMAVYQSDVSGIKRFVRLRSVSNDSALELVVLMKEGALRKYLFPRIAVEVARFDGAAGLLTSFPVAEFETVNDGPFDQIDPISTGFLGRNGPLLHKLNEKFVTEQSLSLSPQRLADFSLFPMAQSGLVCVAVIGVDPYMGRATMNLVDGCDLEVLAKVPLGMQQTQLTLSPLIYVPTRLI